MKIKLHKTKQAGYDRFVEFSLMDGNCDILYGLNMCYEYVETDIKEYKKALIVEATLSIELVINIRTHPQNKSCSFIQWKNSTHTECVGIIKKILDLDSFICEIPELGDIRVELEQDDKKLTEGMVVEFLGCLMVEILE